jgi:hypothetical protein
MGYVSSSRRRDSGRKKKEKRNPSSVATDSQAWGPSQISQAHSTCDPPPPASGTMLRSTGNVGLPPPEVGTREGHTRPDKGTRASVPPAPVPRFTIPSRSTAPADLDRPSRGHCTTAYRRVKRQASSPVTRQWPRSRLTAQQHSLGRTDAASGLHAAVTEIATSANARYMRRTHPVTTLHPAASGDGSLLLLRTPVRPT